MTAIGNASLAYLLDAIQQELDDAASLFAPGILERYINEGLRKLEPEHLKHTSAAISWADAATSAALPTDLYDITRIRPDSSSSAFPASGYRQHGLAIYFDPRDVVTAFSGTLFYRAHYPQIDATHDSELPAPANDALIDYALYKAFHRIAANRAEFRKYATLTTNGVTMGDLLATANGHLADFTDVKTATARVAPPAFYED